MKKITVLARQFRKNPTKAENIFWQAVRNRQISNHKFYRQYPIEFSYYNKTRYFIADFYYHESKLVVEIDGGIHKTQKDYGKLRTGIINQPGMKVIRFSNEEVMGSMSQVIKRLEISLSSETEFSLLQQ